MHRTVRIWDIATPGESSHQIADFARVLSSVHLQRSGRLEPRVVGPFEELRTESQKLGLGTKGALATWFFADPLQRSLSPFGPLTVPAFLESRIQEGTPGSLDEAELLAAGDAEVLNRIESKRNELSSP